LIGHHTKENQLLALADRENLLLLQANHLLAYGGPQKEYPPNSNPSGLARGGHQKNRTKAVLILPM
jgi:hypothetical protein